VQRGVDWTKFEQEKYMKLINELNERKANGGTNLIIRIGCIVSRPIHAVAQAPFFHHPKIILAVISPDECQNVQCSNVLSEPDSDELESVAVYLWNARSIVNKLNNFSSFVYAWKYKIYGITETWLSDHIYNNKVLPTDYVIYHKDCSGYGGGVAIIVFPVDVYLLPKHWSPCC